MKKMKPIDIINAVITEVYGERAVELLRLFSTLNELGKNNIIEYADEYNELEKYTKVITLHNKSVSKNGCS